MTSYRVRGWHVLAAILAFFGAVIAVNATFVVLAVGSFPGEDVRRSYLQGLRYNETLAERRAQTALGWRATADLVPRANAGAVEIALHDASGAPIDGASIEAALERPTRAALDRTLTFASIGEGRYVAPVDALEDGRWRLRARAARADEAIAFEAELIWPTASR